MSFHFSAATTFCGYIIIWLWDDFQIFIVTLATSEIISFPVITNFSSVSEHPEQQKDNGGRQKTHQEAPPETVFNPSPNKAPQYERIRYIVRYDCQGLYSPKNYTCHNKNGQSCPKAMTQFINSRSDNFIQSILPAETKCSSAHSYDRIFPYRIPRQLSATVAE